MTGKKLKDVARRGSHQEVLEAVQEAGAQLAAIAIFGRSTLERTERNVALENLSARIGEELLRVAKNFNEDIDILAWSTRNTFELNLLIRFVLMDDANAVRFLSEA